MSSGFEVTLATDGAARIQFFTPGQAFPPGAELVTAHEDNDAGMAAVLMGQLYYREDLRPHLPLESPAEFASDAALALAVYRHRGARGLESLEGEFALVVVDRARPGLLALRDPMGAWPLYWSAEGGAVRVGTSLLSLARQLPSAPLDLDYLASFLMYPYAFSELHTEQTAFQSLRRLLPGTVVALHPNGRAETRGAWDWEARTDLGGLSLPEAGARFGCLFHEAVRQRIERGKIASHLSGGMDSSSVVCAARNLIRGGTAAGRLTTLSLVYDTPSLAEDREHIALVAGQGEPIDPHYFDGGTVLDYDWFTDGVPTHDEPYAGLFHLQMEKLLMDAAHGLGVTTILTGSGADDFLDGNGLHLAALVGRGRWLAAVREARLWAQAENSSAGAFLYRCGIEPLLPAILRQGLATQLRGGFGRWPKLSMFSISPWVLPGFARAHRMASKGRRLAGLVSGARADRDGGLLSVRSSAGNWSAWHLGAPRGIRIAQPFYDPRLLTFCLSLPSELRQVPGVRKPVLQEAMRGILPEPIRTRYHRSNFNDVYWRGLSRNLSRLEDMVRQSRIHELTLFDQDRLIEAMRQHAVGIGDAMVGGRIGSSLALIAWFDHLPAALSDRSAPPGKSLTVGAGERLPSTH